MNECPFCGAEVKRIAENGEYIRYSCGSVNYHGWSRSINCYETQLAQQTDLLREALEVVEKAKEYDKQRKDGCGLYADWQPVESVLYDNPSLAPKIRAELEKIK